MLRNAQNASSDIGPPVRRKESREGCHKDHAAIVRDSGRQGIDLVRLADNAHAVAEPLDRRARDCNGSLERIGSRFALELVSDRGQEAVVGGDDLLARVEQHKASGSVGVLGLTGLEAMLPHERGVLIAQTSRDGHVLDLAELFVVDSAKECGRGLDLGQDLLVESKEVEALVAPLQGLDVHQHRATGVGHIRHMDTTLYSSCEIL